LLEHGRSEKMRNDGQNGKLGVERHEERDLVEILGHQVEPLRFETTLEVTGPGQIEVVGITDAMNVDAADAVSLGCAWKTPGNKSDRVPARGNALHHFLNDDFRP